MIIGDNMKNLIFDLGGVILSGDPSSVLDKLNLNDEDKLLINKLFFYDFSKLDLGLESLLDHYNNCNFNFDDKVKDELIHYYLYRSYNIEVIDLINKYKDLYNIYILSDNNKEAISYLKDKFRFVKGWIISCDYGSLKRDGKLFDILLDKYHIKAEESLFIDDNIININKGKEKNFNTFLFNDNAGELSNYLNSVNK